MAENSWKRARNGKGFSVTRNYNALLNSSWFRYPPVSDAPFEGLLEAKPSKFDVRGVIQLKGEQLFRWYPLKSGTINVGQGAKNIHFLLGAYGKARIGEKI